VDVVLKRSCCDGVEELEELEGLEGLERWVVEVYTGGSGKGWNFVRGAWRTLRVARDGA
jgi:hypothetical protein